MSQGYSTNLDDLVEIASVNLPGAIANTETALNHADKANGLTKGAFFGAADLFSGLRADWSDTFDQIRTPMAKARDNLDLARQAIIEIEKRYRALEGEE